MISILLSHTAFAQFAVELPSADFATEETALNIPFTSIADHIILEVTINDSHETKLIFDTGYGFPGVVLFDKDLGDSLKLEYSGTVDLGGGGNEGTKRAQIAGGVKLSLPGVRYHDQQILVFEEKDSDFSDLPIDGIIGGTLMGSVVEFDYERSTMSLYHSSSYVPDEEMEVFPIEFSYGIPVIDAELIQESGEALPIKLLFDTGVPELPLLLFPFSSESITTPDQTIEYKGEAMGGEMPISCGRISMLQIGSYLFENVVAGYVKKEDFGSAVVLGQNGMLGHDIIQRFNVVFDYQGKRVYLSPNRGFSRRYELNTAGLGLVPLKNGMLRVSCVVPGSPAEEQGIVEGDLISKINEKAVRDYNYEGLRELFSRIEERISVKVIREDKRMDYEIELRRLV